MQKMKKTIEGSGSDLFICFTSRPSAASASAAVAATLRVPSSKSLMSPNRSGGSNPSIPSLSSSLSRRLRSSGSIKGGQSPMFPAAGASVGRKKGVAFEAAEPSSPKVTCIGQVRVKSKKKKSKNSVTRTRSGREASFRRSEAAGGRKAVSICDALRAFGSEMNCFVPCGWSLCSSGEGEQEQRKRKKRSSSSSCGAAFARWLMAIEEEGEEAEKGRVVGLVVEERGKGEVGVFVREKEMELEVEEYFERRKEEIFERKGEVVVVEKEVEEEEEEEEIGRVSVCIPPRNALLLMRCRSDPVRMAALANRFWDSPAMKVQCEEREEDEEEEEEVGNEESKKAVESKIDKEKEEEEEEGLVGEDDVEQVSLDIEEAEKAVVLDEKKVEALEEEKNIVADEAHEEVEKEVVPVLNLPEEEAAAAEILGEVISAEEAAPEEEKTEGSKAINELIEKEMKEEEALCVPRGGEDEGEEVEIILRRSISCSATKSNELAKAKEGAKRRSFSYREKKEKRRHSFSTEREARRQGFSADKDGRRRWSFSIEKENLGPKEKPIVVQSAKQTKKEEVSASAKEKPVKAVVPEITEKTQAAAVAADEVREKIQVSKRDETQVVVEKEKKSRELPDCLLLMMYEPKLSMEVSKETWVCSTDFRWRPNYSHPTNQPSEAKAKADDGIKAGDKCIKNKNVIAENAAIAQPPPLKPPPPPVSAFEQKLLKSSAVGPLPPPLPQPPYEHFMLTRCKSEPLKSSARLAPDACFWKSRHQPIGTAGQ